MLHSLAYILFRLRLRQPTIGNIIHWETNRDANKLVYLLEHGNYATRAWAAKSLGTLRIHQSIPHLLTAVLDPIRNVSVAAMNALDRMEIRRETHMLIAKHRLKWADKQYAKEQKAKQPKKPVKHTIYRWERASKKSFDRVKEQLKKPMR